MRASGGGGGGGTVACERSTGLGQKGHPAGMLAHPSSPTIGCLFPVCPVQPGQATGGRPPSLFERPEPQGSAHRESGSSAHPGARRDQLHPRPPTRNHLRPNQPGQPPTSTHSGACNLPTRTSLRAEPPKAPVPPTHHTDEGRVSSEYRPSGEVRRKW